MTIAGYWWYMLIFRSFTSEGREHVRIHFLNVGQGDAILIETPNNFQVLVDAGRGIKILNALDELLPMHDRDIDAVVMTHPDADHIGGFVPIFERYAVGTVMRSFIDSDTRVYNAVSDAIRDEGSAEYIISKPYSFRLDGVQFYVLWPVGEYVTETNAASVVLLVSYGSVQTLLTGDAPIAVEDFVVSSFGTITEDVEILKAGHHGSKTSTSYEFLSHTKPNVIVYSVGKNNSYGHPHQDVIDRVEQYKENHPGEILNTYETADGTVSFCLTPAQFQLCD